MKQLVFITLSVMLFSSGVFANDSGDGITTFKVEKEKSKVYWTGKKVTGEHTGTLSLNSGELSVQDDSVISGKVKLDMNSITCTDLTDPQWNKKLVDHLKSDDFFSTEKHPHSVFEVTNFENQKDENNDANYLITGNMTIKGITHQISFPANVEIKDGRLTASGTAVLDRTKWKVEYRSGSIFKDLGDKMIYDEFKIKFDLFAAEETVN